MRTLANQNRPGHARPSPARRRLFILISVLLPIAVLVGLELVLRAFGWGGNLPLVREMAVTPDGVLMVADPEGTRHYFFANRGDAGSNVRFAFEMPKPKDTVRIFLFGGSAIRGWPQTRNLTTAAFLEMMLQDLWLEKRVEVINFGTTAVSSFPVGDMLGQAISYDPDLVVVYTGHNEFYGTYGTASSHRAGNWPWMQRLQHRARALALLQALRSLVSGSEADSQKDLMEIMVGQDLVPPDDRRRAAAARNLKYHLQSMIRRCEAEDVPVIVCTLPSNERDLAPIGEDDLEALGVDDRAGIHGMLRGAAGHQGKGLDQVEATLREIAKLNPDLSLAHFRLGRVLYEKGDREAAQSHFVQARDLDPMPWRATTQSQEAIRAAVADEGALLCDVEALFRERSPGGCIGWELMDDHVHPTLRGQALIAEAIVTSMTNLAGSVHVDDGNLAQLRPWEEYARELGVTDYDRYYVHRWMRIIFEIPFMERSNPGARERFHERILQFEAEQPDAIRKALQGYDSKRPITLVVAEILVQQGDYAGALPLLRSAQKALFPHSAAYMECVHNELGCIVRIKGELNEAERGRVLQEIRRGELLLGGDAEEQWIIERTIGRLHLLREEEAEAIPYLLAAHPNLKGADRVADDRALIHAYLKLGQTGKAREVAQNGIAVSGPYLSGYLRLLAEIRHAETNLGNAPGTNISGPRD